MSLSDNIIRKFEKAINDQNNSLSSTTVYGTIKKTDNGDIYLILDGSTIETPVVTTVDVSDGDRVVATIENHTITISGNLSAPTSPNIRMASMQDGDNYKQWTSKVQAYAQINDSEISAENTDDLVYLDISVTFKGQQWLDSGEKENLSQRVGIRIDNSSIDIDYNGYNQIIVSEKGIDITTSKDLNGSVVTIDGNEILTDELPLFKTGTVTYTDSTGVEANTYKTFSKEVTIPDGYKLVGVTAVKNSAHAYAQLLTGFYHSGSKVYASYSFRSAVSDITIVWTWLAMRIV